MTKKPSTEERFQEWVAAFRAGKPCLNFLMALETMTDDELRPLWKDADRRHQKHLRERKALKEAQAAYAREVAARKKD